MRTWCYNFKEQFVPRVESGAKRQTVRRERRDGRKPAVGDVAKLFTGLRTHGSRLLRVETIRSVQSVQIYMEEKSLIIDGERLYLPQAIDFARADGFESWSHMFQFFRAEYDDDFFGYCMAW